MSGPKWRGEHDVRWDIQRVHTRSSGKGQEGACRRGHKLWLLTGTDACLVKKRGDVNLATSPQAVPNPKPQVSWENRQGWLLAN